VSKIFNYAGISSAGSQCEVICPDIYQFIQIISEQVKEFLMQLKFDQKKHYYYLDILNNNEYF
jgi:hypothetical protein